MLTLGFFQPLSIRIMGITDYAGSMFFNRLDLCAFDDVLLPENFTQQVHF
jgi:hypothetical protein